MSNAPRLKDSRQFNLGTWWGGLRVTGDRSVLLGLAMVLVANGVLAALFLRTYLLDALAAVLLTTALHWVNDTLHQYGHALAARAVGKPMSGLHYFLMLSRGIYPQDEGEVTPQQHIQRALGGPAMSLGVAAVWGVLAWLVQPSPLLAYTFTYAALSSLVVFTLLALAPFPTIDGGSIRYWWRKLREAKP